MSAKTVVHQMVLVVAHSVMLDEYEVRCYDLSDHSVSW